jgi:NDP-sugar pyrophosphorylase family protein
MPTELDAFLLAAGLGTRMGALSLALPKPAWTLQGRSLLQWSAEDLRREGFTRLACNAHLLPHRLREAAEGIEVCEEPVLLGSAGGLLHARGRVREALLVWNADALATVPWASFRAEHLRRGAELSWLLLPHPGGPWSAVWLDAEDRILPLDATTGAKGPFLFSGASCWSPAALDLLPEGPSEVRALLPRLRRHTGISLGAFPWREIGTPQALLDAAADLAPQAEGRMEGCYLHPTARPAGRLRRCVLGPGAAPHPAMADEDALWFEEEGRQVRLGLS